MVEGVILKALSGFYYVFSDGAVYTCKARGNFRKSRMSPLVGDAVEISETENGCGVIEKIRERKNSFIRPAVANIDLMLFVAAGAKPVTDPFLIDRVAVIAENAGCSFAVCINKKDLSAADELYSAYLQVGIPVVRTSAETGEGCEELKQLLKGKRCALTGNSGVGKSSIINMLIPGAEIETDEISEHLGRGKHTTRHVEFYSLDNDTFLADTPGFASFDVEMVDNIAAEDLQFDFPEFAKTEEHCRFSDCRHLSEPGCAVRSAVEEGKIPLSRYESYKKLYDIVFNHKPWE